MHIHNQPVNLYATNIHSPATVARNRPPRSAGDWRGQPRASARSPIPSRALWSARRPTGLPAASGVAIVPAARRRFMRRKKSRPEPSPFMPEPQEQIEHMPSSPSPAIGTPSCRRSAARSCSRMARIHARPARRVKPFILSHETARTVEQTQAMSL